MAKVKRAQIDSALASAGNKNSVDLGVLEDGMVVLKFNELIREMTFTPAQAKSLGMGFIEMGTRGESLQRVTPPGRMQAGPKRVV